jgi:hypothetical protein
VSRLATVFTNEAHTSMVAAGCWRDANTRLNCRRCPPFPTGGTLTFLPTGWQGRAREEVAARTTLNAKNLKALGAERLAVLLIEISTGSAAAKRRLRMELAGAQSSTELAKPFAGAATADEKAIADAAATCICAWWKSACLSR